MHVRFVDLGRQFEALREPLIKRFSEVSEAGAYVLGDEVDRFEAAFAAYCGVRFAIGVGNGTDALALTLRALGVGPGDEVITAPNSFIASAGAIVQIGARPVFADVGSDANLDPEAVERALSPRTRALVPVHLNGMPADMEPLSALATARGIPVVEDAAQAVGATYQGRPAGSLGRAAGFSLHPLKNLHIHGDGGVITTDDPALDQALRRLRNHGLVNRDECAAWGVNSRLDAIQASIAHFKLQEMDAITARFRAIADRYHAGLADVITVPERPAGREGVHHNYVLRSDRRDALQAFLLERGVETKVHYPIPLHLQPAAEALGYRRGDFPEAERQAATILSLPIYPELRDDEIDHVIESVRAFS